MIKNSQPIGIFDSGIGGLTVAKEIIKTLPHENIIYIGDTARVPYGVRGEEVITSFAIELATFLIEQQVKLLVVACNTISAISLEAIQKISPIPVLGVIKPTIKHVLSVTQNNKIGILGTPATIQSKVYEQELLHAVPMASIISQACPLFVPLVEEGLFTHPATKLLAKEYLSVFDKTDIDTLILGCTHYPLLSQTITEIIASDVTVVDSAKPTAIALQQLLQQKNLLHNASNAKRTFYFTDVTKKEHIMMNRIFGEDIAYKTLSTPYKIHPSE